MASGSTSSDPADALPGCCSLMTCLEGLQWVSPEEKQRRPLFSTELSRHHARSSRDIHRPLGET